MKRALATLLLLTLGASGVNAGDARVSSDFQPVRARKSDPDWCWAACIQMCLRDAGIRASQESVIQEVTRTSGEVHDIKDLPTVFVYDKGRKSEITLMSRYLDRPLKRIEILDAFERERVIAAEIGEENPWGVPPHVVLVYGYRIDLMNDLHLKIYDPWPPGRDLPEVAFKGDWGWQRTLLLWAARSDSMDVETNYKNPIQCLNLTQSDIQWGISLHSGTLYYTLTYENLCDRPVRCSVTIQSGSQVNGFALAGVDAWVLSQSRTQSFVLMPGADYTLRGGLRWRRTETTTPQVLYPRPNRGEHLNLIRCDYLDKRAD
jgi:hypothetical protein